MIQENTISITVQHLDTQLLSPLPSLLHRIPPNRSSTLRQRRTIQRETLSPKHTVTGVQEDFESLLHYIIILTLIISQRLILRLGLIPENPQVTQAANQLTGHPMPLLTHPMRRTRDQVTLTPLMAAQQRLVAQIPVPDSTGIQRREVNHSHLKMNTRLGVTHNGTLILLALNHRLSSRTAFTDDDILSIGDKPTLLPMHPLHQSQYPATHTEPAQVLKDHLADALKHHHQVHHKVIVESRQLIGDKRVLHTILSHLSHGQLVKIRHRNLTLMQYTLSNIIQAKLTVRVPKRIPLNGSVPEELVQVNMHAIRQERETPTQRNRNSLIWDAQIPCTVPEEFKVKIIPVKRQDDRVTIHNPECLLHQLTLSLKHPDLIGTGNSPHHLTRPQVINHDNLPEPIRASESHSDNRLLRIISIWHTIRHTGTHLNINSHTPDIRDRRLKQPSPLLHRLLKPLLGVG